MTELDAARAIRDGGAPSPSRFGNAWLHDIRISGSGIAERPAYGETAYRDPAIWCSDEMVTRAAGLPVVLGHPAKGVLDGQEFAGRVVGTIVLPYAKDSELRGVARIFDDTVSAAMASGEFSTSPSATYAPGSNTAVAMQDGILLIEGNPSLLDHIAIVVGTGDAGAGVWDKGGPSTGIRTDSLTSTEANMADETEKTAAEKAMEEHGAKLDKLVEGMSAMADMCTSMGKRLDDMEEGMKNRADGTGKNPGNWLGTPISEDEHKEREGLVDAQKRADIAAQSHSQRAPKPMVGETSLAYRARVLREFQRFSPAWKGVDLTKLAADKEVFAVAENAIYADAMEAARNPVVPAGTLREIVRKEGVHEIHEFYGKPSTWMDQFKSTTSRARFKSPREIAGIL